jgi:hypothetical protein
LIIEPPGQARVRGRTGADEMVKEGAAESKGTAPI